MHVLPSIRALMGHQPLQGPVVKGRLLLPQEVPLGIHMDHARQGAAVGAVLGAGSGGLSPLYKGGEEGGEDERFYTLKGNVRA